VKVPLTEQGLRACRTLRDHRGIEREHSRGRPQDDRSPRLLLAGGRRQPAHGHCH
jgi:hypothetical protein